MSRIFIDQVTEIANEDTSDRYVKMQLLVECSKKAGYTIEDVDSTKPWGGYVRFGTNDADKFLKEFFPDVDPVSLHLGTISTELSPKLLLVASEQRLSWQVHERRAERWVFLNDGGYYRSIDPENPGNLIEAHAGTEVQFAAGECHRLVGGKDGFTLVAEIWQHADPNYPSDEADITRLQDDYQR